MAFDINKLTLGEVAKIESWSGLSIEQIGNDSAPRGKAMAALLTVFQRRNGQPKFAFSDALDVPTDEAYEMMGMGDDDEANEASEGDEAPKDQEPATRSRGSRSSSSTPASRAKKPKD